MHRFMDACRGGEIGTLAQLFGERVSFHSDDGVYGHRNPDKLREFLRHGLAEAIPDRSPHHRQHLPLAPEPAHSLQQPY